MFIKNLGRCLFLTAIISSISYGDWESDANTRIENIRKRNARISLVNSLSQPVSGINVQIEQVEHRFAFGTCISNSKMSDNNYKNFIINHFNWAVCENDTKWGANEPTRDYETYTNADSIYNWCNSNGIKMRGHCLFWEQVNGEFPSWVESLPYATYPTSSELLGEVDERIVSAVNHFKGKYYNWDVDNEMLTDSFFTSRLGNAGIAHMFNAAKALDPDCGMFMNEYNGNSFGSYSSYNYVNRANTLIGLGATIDGYGIQAHLAENVTFQPQTYYDSVLQPLAVFGKPIWATEFDASHTNLTISADNIENFFRICFSHANVEGIIMWGFMQNAMWRSNAYLVQSDGITLSPAGVRYEALMDEWTTDDNDTTDINGNVDFRGFHGTYEITLSAPGQSSEVYEIELEPGTTTAEFEIETALHSPDPNYNPPTPVEMLGSWTSGLSHTKETGSNRALIFIAHAEYTSSMNLSSVTYGGQTMTKIMDWNYNAAGGWAYTAAYILKESGIAAATTSTFVPTWSINPGASGYSSVFLSNVDQTTSTGATASGGSTTNPVTTSTSLANNDGDMVILAATCGYLGSYILNNDFIEGTDQQMSSTATGVTGRKSATGAAETPNATFSPAASLNRQMIIGFAVKAAPPAIQDCTDVQAGGFGLLSDLNGDCFVNFGDLEVVSQYWLSTDCAVNNDCDGADFVPTDGIVNFLDFSDFALQWMLCNEPQNPNCIQNW